MAGHLDIETLVVKVVDAMNERDHEALLALVHPEYEFHAHVVAVHGGAYRGPDGLRDYFRDLGETFTDLRWSVAEVVPGPGEEAVVALRFTARGRESRTPVDTLLPNVWSFRDGKPWRSVVHPSLAAALDAAGVTA